MSNTTGYYARRSSSSQSTIGHDDLALVLEDGSNSTSSAGPSRSVVDNRAEGLPRDQKRKRARQANTQEGYSLSPWLSLLSNRRYETVNQRLHHEVFAYMNYMMPTIEEMTARQKVVSCISRVIKRRFADGEVKVFGSSATGLYLPTGDIDLVFSSPEIGENKKKTLFRLSALLKAAKLTDDVIVNHQARVPILTFTMLPDYGSFSVDIGINNVDGLQSLSVIKHYLETMPALHPLFLVVKGFLSQRQLNDAAKSGLGSYALICMCISFLQLNPGKRSAEFITKPGEAESLGALLTDFMLYYGFNFPYSTSYISVTNGKLLPKASADWISKKALDRLAIQCPVHPDNDVGKSAGRINAIRSAFKSGHVSISRLSVEDTNALGSIVCVSQSTLDHRSHIHHIVSSGKLDATISPPLRLHKHLPLLPGLPPFVPRNTRPHIPRDTENIPYRPTFGEKSSMDRRSHETGSRGWSYNRRQPGFRSSKNGQSRVSESGEGASPVPATEGRSEERSHVKRRRVEGRFSR